LDSGTLEFNFVNAAVGVPTSITLQGTSAVLQPGVISPTSNPLVALYTMTLPFPGQMRVEFGSTAAYGRDTWWQSTDQNNVPNCNSGQICILVAGMVERSLYHMAAEVQFDSGLTTLDQDHTFTTGSALDLRVTATTEPGKSPQPGIEMLNALSGLGAANLNGQIIWSYVPPDQDLGDSIDGVKLLPDGDMLVVLGLISSAPLSPPLPPEALNEIREINLAGDTIKEISVEDLNAELSTATCAECQDGPDEPLILQTFHHDVTPLPNGHWLILANELRTLSTTSKPPLTNAPSEAVLGDVIVDVDENLQPDWVWNEFNHLDPDRHPFNFPDWTHTNAILYSPDDHNILVSIRHQNWVLKVDFQDGTGNGDIIWKLGEGGTFKLIGGSDPVDWQYAQHDPGFFSPNTTGTFDLGVMDNGDDRLYPTGSSCTPQANLPNSCRYSTIPIFQIDETAKTATLIYHDVLPAAWYNDFGGNIEQLENGDIEYDLCGLQTPKPHSLVREVQQDADSTPVWSLSLTNGNFYRAFRVPSLYPGVKW
jgi:arylsulfate sulfotransferase